MVPRKSATRVLHPPDPYHPAWLRISAKWGMLLLRQARLHQWLIRTPALALPFARTCGPRCQRKGCTFVVLAELGKRYRSGVVDPDRFGPVGFSSGKEPKWWRWGELHSRLWVPSRSVYVRWCSTVTAGLHEHQITQTSRLYSVFAFDPIRWPRSVSC